MNLEGIRARLSEIDTDNIGNLSQEDFNEVANLAITALLQSFRDDVYRMVWSTVLAHDVYGKVEMEVLCMRAAFGLSEQVASGLADMIQNQKTFSEELPRLHRDIVLRARDLTEQILKDWELI